MIPTVGALLALSAALAAACFVKAFGVTFLGRARTLAAATADEVDRFSIGSMLAFAALCLVAGVLPGLFMDALAPVADALVGGRLPVQTAMPWLSIVPVAASRSSYNGLLVFAFIAGAAATSAYAIHGLASRAFRRSPAWDCGFPLQTPQMQYTAGSFAQPIRRVFGTTVFAAREHVSMPEPGDLAPAHFHVDLRDYAWDGIYAPLAATVSTVADRLNRFQFLTIRQYLSLVFVALVVLLIAVAAWP
jgi:hypothetical protein